MLNSRSTLPGLAERFYAAGEERAKLRLPDGYGYKINAADKWGMTWMLMNHRKTDGHGLHPVPGDLRHGAQDTRHAVLAGHRELQGRPGVRHPGRQARRARPPATPPRGPCPQSGRIVAAGGHVHGGAKQLDLKRTGPDCTLYSSKPTWGSARHPFYNVRPVLHEPGPINMSGFTSATGMPVRKGERLRMDADYDGELHAHPRDGHHDPVPGARRRRPGHPLVRAPRPTCATGPPASAAGPRRRGSPSR